MERLSRRPVPQRTPIPDTYPVPVKVRVLLARDLTPPLANLFPAGRAQRHLRRIRPSLNQMSIQSRLLHRATSPTALGPIDYEQTSRRDRHRAPTGCIPLYHIAPSPSRYKSPKFHKNPCKGWKPSQGQRLSEEWPSSSEMGNVLHGACEALA